jgi:hypothetical protein
VVATVTYAYTGKTDASEAALFRLIAHLIGLAILAAWFGYFRTSQRVKATYGSNL